MLKVLYLLNHAGKGGSEKYVERLVEEYHNNRAKCFLVYNEDGPLVNKMQEKGVKTYRLEMRDPFDLKAAKELSNLCKSLDIDVIHTQFLRENYISILSKIYNPKIRVVYTNHVILYNNRVQKIFNKIMTPFDKGIIAVSNKSKEVMIDNGVSKNRINVIYNGIDMESRDQESYSTIREEFDISKDDYILLNISRFSPEKGPDFFIKSISRLEEISSKGFKCLMVGDGPLLEETKKLSKELNLNDKVIFTGFRKDIPNILNGSDIFINSSSNENLSFAILEAISKGLPVVATDVGGTKDIVNESNNCGILVKYGDEEEMAGAVEEIMSNPKLYEKYSKNGLSVAKDKFDIEIMFKKTFELYEN